MERKPPGSLCTIEHLSRGKRGLSIAIGTGALFTRGFGNDNERIRLVWENPGIHGRHFRASGYKNVLKGLDDDNLRYGGDQRWDDYIAKRRSTIDFDMRINGFTLTEVQQADWWPTLSRYLRSDGRTPLTPHQDFLKTLTLGFWQEYSAISHGTFHGLLGIAGFLAPRDLPHEDRPKVDDAVEVLVSTHVARVSGILLSTLTEVQAYFGFDGANINARLHKIWDVLIQLPEIKELYDKRYNQLMQDKGI